MLRYESAPPFPSPESNGGCAAAGPCTLFPRASKPGRHLSSQWRMAMKTMLMTTAALALLATGAHADNKAAATCSLWSGLCVFNQTLDAETRIIHIPAPMQIQPDDEQWVRFCRPRFLKDSLGVEHAVYAHPGCDVGRDH